jgi:penicillin-binding protein 1A
VDKKAEQYYPTYKADHRDVLLIEFEEAQKIANGQTKVYGQVTNILLAVATFAFTFLLDQNDKKSSKVLTLLFSNSISFSIILFLFGAIILRYFVDLQKQITINARKVVVLRTLLGLDYGHIHLTLPDWRVEGATNPFVIKYFNGWLNFKTMPFWLLTITVNSIWWLTTKDIPTLSITLWTGILKLPWIIGNVLFSLTYLLVFRRNLNDRYETTYLNFVEIFCFIFKVKLIDNFEYIIYRAKLSYLELDRLKVNYEKFIKVLVDIEDNDFNSNIGISFKSLLRGFLSRFKIIRNKTGYIQHGGSTITMQLTRSLFIPSNQNKYLRKITELLLSLWLTRQFSKGEILKLYVASVRFESGVLGLSNAIKHFFGDLKAKELTSEEAFFLVERLSNITSTVNCDRISHLLTRTKVEIDENKLIQIYKGQIKCGRLKK